MSSREQKPTPVRYTHSGLFAWRTALLPFAELFGGAETAAAAIARATIPSWPSPPIAGDSRRGFATSLPGP